MAMKYAVFLLLVLAFATVPFVNAATTCQINSLKVTYPSIVTGNIPFQVYVSFYPACVGFGAEYRVVVLDGSGNLVGEATSTMSHIMVPVTVRGLGSDSLIVQISMVNGSAYGETGWTVPLTISSIPIVTQPCRSTWKHGEVG